ncbi:hypothetical protein TWF569_008370 [Orbilia oligospora]|uniref:AB hydrolase-1 domain-containing protein n=1 Tax=Orbilia oligospora TaxID=2813651 RepID=A0A7C8NKC5_ORBOL|nr:hypothetical protein TWF103_002109 [Orbilia oligospora]KAF3088704.1 hypothetical protein TWF102_010078 [Orbilia oligospora]KAF3106800.1 hypothetical protein TWF706_003292 [Orbilia oligospora]KAF3119675.1 hypothetical protein TWF703_003226 [Orbilia oligospora]KAF3122617.1 hypothetical protein TWF594_002772 [Orbilia oligospora]
MAEMLSIPELLAHPGMQEIVIPFTPSKTGLAEVAIGRGGPIKINYEIHGTGPIKLVFIMGLRAPLIAWQRQIRYFGHEHGERYSMLVFDNRGVGASDKPLMRYTTSEMALDTRDLMDHLGWIEPVHMVGVSMGGMILQEFAYRFPDRLASVVFQSTAAVIKAEVPFFENLRRRAALIKPKTLEERLQAARENLFGHKFLNAPDEMGTFPTNADRFNAEEIWKTENVNQPPFLGFMSQLVAAGWHSCSPERLRYIGDHVKYVLVAYGGQDKMIEPPHSEHMIKCLGPRVRSHLFPDAGHVISTEHVHEYNDMVRELIEEAAASVNNVQ